MTFQNKLCFRIECHPYSKNAHKHTHGVIEISIHTKKVTLDAKTNLHNQIVFHTFIFKFIV